MPRFLILCLIIRYIRCLGADHNEQKINFLIIVGINAIRPFESMFHYIQAEIVGIVHGSADAPGDIVKQPVLMEQAYQLGHKLAQDD